MATCLRLGRSRPTYIACVRYLALSASHLKAEENYKLVIIGGGSAGCAASHKFAKLFPAGQVAVVEPSDVNYYQPMWTLVGGGMKTMEQSMFKMKDVLNPKAKWIKEKCVQFKPEENTILTDEGREISYDYLIVALGIQLRYDLIKGLPEAFNTPGVCSNYHSEYCKKTIKAIEQFKSGNAIFSFPATPIKCAGAPQKIMYIAEDYFRKHGKRDKANIIYNTSLPVIFGIKKYAEVLDQICVDRGITVNYKRNLVEVKPDSKEAVFAVLDADNKPIRHETSKYEMLHVGAPCSAPEALRTNKSANFVDQAGFLDVDKHTLQHKAYANVFGIGDCINAPTAKTAAAVAAQLGVLQQNFPAVVAERKLPASYDGYTSCPLVTGYSKCVLAEFDYTGEPLETFPMNQRREARWAFIMKKDLMPLMYKFLFLRGYWNGPGFWRKVLRFGSSK